MTDTTSMHPVSWLAQHTPEQLKLAKALDSLHEAMTFASCMDGEADRVWNAIIDHVTGQWDVDSRARHDAPAVADLVATMRKLGGTWGGEGCLWKTAYPTDAEYDETFDPDVHEFYGDQVTTWYTLEEMAARTGRGLPAA